MQRSNTGPAWGEAIQQTVQELPLLPEKQRAYEAAQLQRAVEDAKAAGLLHSNKVKR